MLHGIYLSAQGANVQSQRHDIIANNLANASTTAFKRDVPVFSVYKPRDFRPQFPVSMDGQRQNEVGSLAITATKSVHVTGASVDGGDLDIALQGDGFLRVSDGKNEFLTRNGRMLRSNDGRLTMEDTGYEYLDSAGTPIQIPGNARQLSIGTNGSIQATSDDGVPIGIGQLDLVSVDTNALKKNGDSLYSVDPDTELLPAYQSVSVRQGYLEASGVEPIHELTAMIESSRAFEANINMTRLQDESLGRLLQSVAG